MLSQPLLPLGNGRYDLREVLGAGGMATVYRAYDQRLQCERAIKVLTPALSERVSVRNRFIAEARMMARLQHPNIVHVDEVVYDEGPVYMVMEMVRRGSLTDILRQHGAMPPRLASAVLQPVLQALAVAHQAGIIHRDIKPHNILMTETGIPKLTDFGIAQIRGTSTSNTRTNTMMGTLAYMAPEQRSSAKRVDARSDVYSVGATLYTLATLKEPHDIFAQELQPELLAGVHEELATFIRHATRYKPEERYQSARDMLAALRALHPRLPGAGISWAGIDGGLAPANDALPPDRPRGAAGGGDHRRRAHDEPHRDRKHDDPQQRAHQVRRPERARCADARARRSPKHRRLRRGSPDAVHDHAARCDR